MNLNIRRLIKRKPKQMTGEWETSMQVEKLKGMELMLVEFKKQTAILKKIERRLRE